MSDTSQPLDHPAARSTVEGNFQTNEQGEPTQWDIAWREGYTSALEAVLGTTRREAHRLAKSYWRPGKGWRVRLARRLLKADVGA